VTHVKPSPERRCRTVWRRGNSTDPSVTAFQDSAAAFFSDGNDGATVQAKVYNLARIP
jgi:hypothetical protein